MPSFTRGMMRPHIARVLLGATDKQMVPKDVRAKLQSELRFSAIDLAKVGAGHPRWWQAALNAVTGGDGGLQKKGLIDARPDSPGNRWRLTDPAGIAWAHETVMLHADQMRRDTGQLPDGGTPGDEPSEPDEENDSLPYQPDARVRKAVEDRAVKLASEKYAADFHITEKGKPYDLECVHKKTGAVRHVEVKGFQDEDPPKAILTRNEVLHVLEGKFPVDFIVAVGIVVVSDGKKLIGTGGTIPDHLFMRDWKPGETDFPVTQHTYKLPREAGAKKAKPRKAK